MIVESRNLPVPITISLIKPKKHFIGGVRKPTEVNILKTIRFRSRKTLDAPPRQRCKIRNICRWYKRKRALKQLIKEHRREQEIQERKNFEKTRLRDFILWESIKPKVEYKPSVETVNKYKAPTVKRKPPLEKPIKYKPPPTVLENRYKYQSAPVPEKEITYYKPYYEPYVPKVEKQQKYMEPVITKARDCGGICLKEKPTKQARKKSKSISVKKL
ncbi:unnamed protein product [Leptosia nina]|uniref:Uncharacterized protein n=1 Tax=Leptosia nina TaxID=320188 RepID=A0AAV1K3M9_9NEOP